jgi:site-specific DNA-methyltransferase (adenine-specific)
MNKIKNKKPRSINSNMNKHRIKIENEDCLIFLKSIESESIDLILTDPPYEISRTTGFESVVNGVKRFAVSMDFGDWDWDFKGLDEVIFEFYRILKKGGTIIIFYDLWKISLLAKMLENAKFRQLRFIEWIKTNPVPLNSKVNYLTNAREIAITATKIGKPKFNSKYDDGIYSFPIYHGKNRTHPTQKPLELFKELIKKHSNKDDVVLDCFLGSGTTAVAAKETWRKFIGCELDQKYYESAMMWVGEGAEKNE